MSSSSLNIDSCISLNRRFSPSEKELMDGAGGTTGEEMDWVQTTSHIGFHTSFQLMPIAISHPELGSHLSVADDCHIIDALCVRVNLIRDRKSELVRLGFH